MGFLEPSDRDWKDTIDNESRRIGIYGNNPEEATGRPHIHTRSSSSMGECLLCTNNYTTPTHPLGLLEAVNDAFVILISVDMEC